MSKVFNIFFSSLHTTMFSPFSKSVINTTEMKCKCIMENVQVNERERERVSEQQQQQQGKEVNRCAH